MTTPSRLQGYPDHRLPDFLILNVADLVKEFHFQWKETVDCNFRHDPSFKPDVNKVVRLIFEAIRHEDDAEQDLGVAAYYEITALAYFDINAEGVIETYSRTNAELSNLAVRFGKALITRLRSEGTYREGYLPYHFSGWLGDTIVVALDECHGGQPLKDHPENVHYLPKETHHSYC
jgi:hypothetical protein